MHLLILTLVAQLVAYLPLVLEDQKDVGSVLTTGRSINFPKTDTAVQHKRDAPFLSVVSF